MKGLVFATAFLAFLLTCQGGGGQDPRGGSEGERGDHRGRLQGGNGGKTRGVSTRQGIHVHVPQREVPALPRRAGYFLLPKRLEAAARYSSVDPDRDKVRDRQIEVTGAVSYYFQGHNLKVQGDYTNIHAQVAGKQATDDKQVRVQAQLAF